MKDDNEREPSFPNSSIRLNQGEKEEVRAPLPWELSTAEGTIIPERPDLIMRRRVPGRNGVSRQTVIRIGACPEPPLVQHVEFPIPVVVKEPDV